MSQHYVNWRGVILDEVALRDALGAERAEYWVHDSHLQVVVRFPETTVSVNVNLLRVIGMSRASRVPWVVDCVLEKLRQYAMLYARLVDTE